MKNICRIIYCNLVYSQSLSWQLISRETVRDENAGPIRWYFRRWELIPSSSHRVFCDGITVNSRPGISVATERRPRLGKSSCRWPSSQENSIYVSCVPIQYGGSSSFSLYAWWVGTQFHILIFRSSPQSILNLS